MTGSEIVGADHETSGMLTRVSGPEVEFPSITDGAVVLRACGPDDVPELIAGRDDEYHRWLGPAIDDRRPIACIVVDRGLVGWVDFDTDRSWLQPGEVNIGYHLFAPHRRRGYATRALMLLLAHLGRHTEHHTATLLIAPDNDRSLAVAHRAGFRLVGDLDGNPYFARAVPRMQ
jgi:RimJ/RimL family protein N-acetyltransferase